MVCSATKDLSLMCHDISSQIRRETASYLDRDEMKSVRFRLRANSHDPSLSDDMCATSSRTQNEMGKIVRPKENKPLSEREIARIKRNKRISRRKDVCKSMPVFLEDDSPESLEDRIKAIVLDTSAKRSKDDDALLQSTANLDDVIQGRISRGSNITDTEKIYHKLCRRTKSFIFSTSKVTEMKTKQNDKMERRSRSRSRSVADDKENSKRSQNVLTSSGVVSRDLIVNSTEKQRHNTKDHIASKVIIPKSTYKQRQNTKDYIASKDIIPESAKYTDKQPQNIKNCIASKDLIPESAKYTNRNSQNNNNFSTESSQIVKSKFSLTNHQPIKNTKGIQTSDLTVKTIVQGNVKINEEKKCKRQKKG